jgi:hypothetical protein
MLGNEVPVDGVAERFVHAHAVDLNRQALGGTEQRGSREAAIVNVDLEGIAGALAHDEAQKLLLR